MFKRLGLILGIALVWCGSASALPTANSAIFPQTPSRIIYQFGATANCTGPAAPYPCCTGSAAGCVAATNSVLYTAGANGSKCVSLWMNSSDNVAHAITFEILSSTVTTKGPGTILSSTASGVSGTFTTPQSILNATTWPGAALDSDGNYFIELNSGDTLNAQFATAITAGNVVDFSGVCYDF